MIDWRIVIAVFVVATGAIIGWLSAQTIAGAVLSAVFVSALFVIDWLIDKYVYKL